MNKLICGDCIEVLPNLPKAALIWADPPDNIDCKYEGYEDRLESTVYMKWIANVMKAAFEKAGMVWLSYNNIYQLP